MEVKNEMLDYIAGQEKHICDRSCKFYQKAFEHNDKACVLSDVFSVKKGELCSMYETKKDSSNADMV